MYNISHTKKYGIKIHLLNSNSRKSLKSLDFTGFFKCVVAKWLQKRGVNLYSE